MKKRCAWRVSQSQSKESYRMRVNFVNMGKCPGFNPLNFIGLYDKVITKRAMHNVPPAGVDLPFSHRIQYV